MTNGLMHLGTTCDDFFRDNLDWISKASNCNKFNAVASIGIIHKGHESAAMKLLDPYLPKAEADGFGYKEGGSMYALGMTGFFALTMVSVVILNGSNGIYQNSIFGLAGDFPFKYTNAVIIGNNLCGTFVTIVNIITFSLTSNVPNSAFAYFTISLVTFGLCFASFFILKKQRLADSANADPITKQDYLDTLKHGWLDFVNVFFVFFVTLTCFPGLMADVGDQGAGEKYGFFLPKQHFVTITTFLLFNVLAFIGALVAGKVQYPQHNRLWVPVYMRLLLIPFFAFCNYSVNTRTWPVLFPNTWIFILGGTIMSLSSGYLSGLGMMYSPRAVDESKQRIAGMMAGFFLIFGIVSGLTFTIFVSWFIESAGPMTSFVHI